MLALLKLQNGTEVIGTVKEDRGRVTIEDPLQVNYRVVASQPMPMVSISRYMPFSRDVTFTFEREDVVHIVPPRDSMVTYYKSALKNYRNFIDQNIDEELLHAAQNDEEVGDSDDEEGVDNTYKALLERINFKGPLN